MEACMMKPEVRKKPKQSKPPPKPTEKTEKPTPAAPRRPADAELTHTQYRMKISAALNDKSVDVLKQQNVNTSEAAVVPLRPAEKNLKVGTRTDEHRKSSRGADRPEAASDPLALPGMFRRSQKAKTPTFTSYMIDDKEEKTDDVSIKWSHSNKPISKADGETEEEEETSEQTSVRAAGETSASRFLRGTPTSDSVLQEKGGFFSGIFKKSNKPEEDVSSDVEVPVSNENLSENKQERSGGLFSGFFKRRGEKTETPHTELSASSEDLSENNTEKNIFSNVFRKAQKPAEGATAEMEVSSENPSPASSENLTETSSPKEKKGGLAGIFKRSGSLDNLLDEDRNIFSGMFNTTPKPTKEESNTTSEDKKLFESSENLLETNTTKEKTGGLAAIFKKSPKPALRSVVTQDPLSDSKQFSASCNSLADVWTEDVSAQEEMSASNDNLSDATKEKRVGFSGIFRRTPKSSEQQEGEENPPPSGAGLKRKRTVKKKRRVVSFRIRKTQPKQSPEKMAVIEEIVEMQDLMRESTVVVEPVEMAAYPNEDTSAEAEQENDELMEWWNTVKGWTEWNETSDFQEEEETAMEQVADRVFMAARVFVYLFNQRGASLQLRILELLEVADAADEFHKKTVSAAVGGGVASVCGSVATITGLILAPFTFGASIIVTAVGIGVATAGSITSATANITDTVHSNMDRKKVERMIQGYQEEIKDIRLCLEFVQEGMDALQEWDFEKYSESAAKKALNHNIKHVMKEGGRAGKALMINTDKLISTVQVLGSASGVAKAAQAISVTTGVMSALFLALDVFFLAKDSHELRKGAKTKFASKIRQVCKELQDGLLALNKVKTQLQKTMDGIEVEEYEEIVEVEVEEDLESDPKKLAELEQEIDVLEEKLDKKGDGAEEKKSKEAEGGKGTRIVKEKEELEESSPKSKSEKTPEEKTKINKTTKEVVQTGKKNKKETENMRISGKEQKHEKMEEDTKPEGEKTERRSREDEGRPTRRHSSRSDKDETRDRKEETGSHRRDRGSERSRGEERGKEDRRKESRRGHKEEAARRERESEYKRSAKETKTCHHRSGHGQREEARGGGRVENARRRFERAAGEEEEEERRQKRREERESRRRGGDGEPNRKGPRCLSDSLKENGLNI